MPVDLSKILSVGQLAGNALSLPARLDARGRQSQLDNLVAQTILQQMGPSATATTGAHGLPADPRVAGAASGANPIAQLLQASTAQPQTGPIVGAIDPSQHPGTYGKILSGVGDVGLILSALTGGDGMVAPPRVDPSTISSLASMENSRASREATAAWRASTSDLNERKFGETTRENRARDAARGGAGGGIKKPFDLWRREHPSGSYQEWMDDQGTATADAAGKRGAATAKYLTPSAERDLAIEAADKQQKNGWSDAETAQWKDGRRIELAGSKAGAVGEAGIAPAVEKTRQQTEIRNQAISSATKTMLERAPKVKMLVQKAREQLEKIVAGPGASRYQEMMTGKGGLSNPEFFRFRTQTKLLTSALTQMHSGNRSGEAQAARFDSMIGAGFQDPSNMAAAFDEIDDYADDLIKTPRTVKSPGELEGRVDTSRPQTGESTAPGAARGGQLDDGFTVEFHN